MRDLIWRAAFVVGWVTLVLVIFYTGREVAVLVEESKDLTREVNVSLEREVRDAGEDICGAWQTDYYILASLREFAPNKRTQKEIDFLISRFYADYKAKCGSYTQDFPPEPS